MRRYLTSIIGFVVFVASSNISIAAGTGCKSHYYQTQCQEDKACNWNTKRNECQANKTYIGCQSHGEFYCEANGCHWDSLARKCTESPGTQKPVSAPKSTGK
jgi:hypothetical protein